MIDTIYAQCRDSNQPVELVVYNRHHIALTVKICHNEKQHLRPHYGIVRYIFNCLYMYTMLQADDSLVFPFMQVRHGPQMTNESE